MCYIESGISPFFYLALTCYLVAISQNQRWPELAIKIFNRKSTTMSKLLLVIGLLLKVIIGSSQNNTAVETSIRNLEQKVIKGILDADTNVLKQLWAPEFMVNTPRNDVAENRDVVFKSNKPV